jgi:MFS family permease
MVRRARHVRTPITDSHAVSTSTIWRDALRQPAIRRLELGWGLSLAGTFAYTVALLVYAYDEGGAALVAAYGVAATVPGAVITPLLMSLGDRLGAAAMLRWTTATRAGLVALAAGIAWSGGPALLVVGLVAAAHGLSAIFRPTQASALPWLARTPAELTAATVAATLVENLAALAGPLLAGTLLAVADAPTAMAVAGLCLLLATSSLRRLAVPEAARSSDHVGLRKLVQDAAAGGVALGRIGRPAGMVVLAFAQPFVRGALLVLMIVLALDTLQLGQDSIGWLNAAIGLGGMLGAAAASRVVRLSRLGRCFVVGVAGWGLGVLALSGAPTGPTAFAALVLVGVANAFQDASAFILMPRLLGPELAGRALGAFELVVMAGMGCGSLVAPVLADGLGVRMSLVVLGAGLALLALGYRAPFATIDRELPQPGPDAELLHAVPVFAPLPVVVIDQLTLAVQEHHYRDGDPVMREGEPGDHYYVITAGSAAVTVAGDSRPALGAGDGFGEIALLRDVPRTATVTAVGPLAVLSLARERFLSAVSGNQVSVEAAESLARRRLAGDPPA